MCNLKENKSSFECLYEEHASLFAVLKCHECGTVVIYREDENYEPKFSCPVCTDYKTSYQYWTKEIIDNDDFVKHSIELFEALGNCEKNEIQAIPQVEITKNSLGNDPVLKKQNKR